MVRVEPRVNRSITMPLVGAWVNHRCRAKPASISRHNRLAMMRRTKRLCRCTMHSINSSPNGECYSSSIALSLPDRSRQSFVRLSSVSLDLGLPYSARPRLFAHQGGDACVAARHFDRRNKEHGRASMATLYSDSLARVGRHVFGDAATYPIRKIQLSDLGEALRLGWEDFKAMPSHAVVLCVIYPVLGIALFRMVLGYSVLPLLFPLAAGFALLGPFAAIGLYELSRRRERGEDVGVWDALHVLRAPAFGAMIELGVLLLVLFGAWIGVANAIYVEIFGPAPAASIPA